MRMSRAILVIALLATMLGLSGCFLKKKKPAVPQPQAQAPTVETAPQPAAPAPAPTASEPNRPQPEAAAPSVATTPTPPPPPAKTKSKPKRTAKKPAPPPAPAPEKRVVVEQGGAKQPSGPQLSASLPHDATIHRQLNTAQLLEATDYNLKSISRSLTTDEQAMVQHIRSYMQQSREATKEGDVERAYNLAMKAHLLSDELVKP